MTCPSQLILCADDYGQHVGVSDGICHLLAAKRLSAVSCMTTTSEWPRAAKAIAPYCGNIDIGLHLNLTDPPLLTQASMPLQQLIRQSMLGKLTFHCILNEFHAQWDQFVEHINQAPDFIDGHQHTHHLPIIRDALLLLYKQRAKKHRPYIRIAALNSINITLKRPHWIKQSIIHFTGAAALRALLKKQQISHNKAFAGIYDFQPTRDYGSLFKIFLATMESGTLIMCHPGYEHSDQNDPICEARLNELNYFSSDTFIHDLIKHNVQLCRFQDTVYE